MSGRTPLLSKWAAVRTEALRQGWDQQHLSLLGLQQGAVALRTWSIIGLPGAVQSPEYISAQRRQSGDWWPSQIERTTRLRLSIAVLLRAIPQQHFIAAELLRQEPDGDRQALRGQLRLLAGLARASRLDIDVRILPRGAIGAMPIDAQRVASTHNLRRVIKPGYHRPDDDCEHPQTMAEGMRGGQLAFTDLSDLVGTRIETITDDILAAADEHAMPSGDSIVWLEKRAAELAD